MSENNPIEDIDFKVHFLDVGPKPYGDCILCQVGKKIILIDGAHPGDQHSGSGFTSIPDQIGKILNIQPPYPISLLVVTHTHLDHTGCLPAMVKDKQLSVKWALVADEELGWGPESDAADPAFRLTAALREEPIDTMRDDAAVAEFITDSASQRSRYHDMLETLTTRKTKVVRYRRNQSAKINQLVKAFSDVGLKILGPTFDHLEACAEVIRDKGRDAARGAADYLQRDSAARNDRGAEARAYRELVRSLDATKSNAAINDQSIVLRLKRGKHRVLLTGDMQFADPEVDALSDSIEKYRKAVVSDGDYGVVKLPHHASRNAASAAFLALFPKTKLFTISTGSQSDAHPSPEALQALKEANPGGVHWMRTDKNGCISVFLGEKIFAKKQKGEPDDATPNNVDLPPSAERPATAPLAPRPIPVVPQRAAPQLADVPSGVEVTARIPHTATRVIITIDVQPGAFSQATDARALTTSNGYRLGGGRLLPPLLFVTSAQALTRNIGQGETAAALGAVNAAGQSVCDLPEGCSLDAASAQVRQQLRANPSVRGVVVLGGYDVVPSQRLDVLDPQLQLKVTRGGDPDRFIVWSDQLYGSLDDQSAPTLPVSRIPDGKSSEVVSAALSASPPEQLSKKFCIYNMRRPFAKGIFDRIPGTGSIHVSGPFTHGNLSTSDWASQAVYLMLHGDYSDATAFWGEGVPGGAEAVNVQSVPARSGGIVFTGCCWGALCVSTPAGRALAGRRIVPRAVDDSLALNFLLRGAQAFVGCTGAHYSPIESPFQYFGGPLHQAFWARLSNTTGPAEALFLAKKDYLSGLPHRPNEGPVSEAIEKKIAHQYTCLGLGW